MNDKLIKTQNLYELLNFEPLVILAALVLLSWLFYKLFLREVSQERHKNLRSHFANLLRHFLILNVVFVLYEFTLQLTAENPLSRALPYLAVGTLAWGILVFVKASRLIVLQYLFLGSMRTGVPVLIVNIFSLVLTLVLVLWTTAHIFGIQLGPLLATSAAFSIILGLALQDTLGNLFAGISLQLDKSFEIGDWIEILSVNQKIVGQVKEVTWRATLLTGWSNEVMTLPNRTVANSQISNFHSGAMESPIARSQIFRLSYGVNVNLAKQCLLEAIKQVSRVRQDPSPVCLIAEATDSWLTFKLGYFIDDYGTQYSIGDEVTEAGLQYLKANGIETMPQTFRVLSIPLEAKV